MIQKNGKTFYVYPDAAHNQAYVGGPQEYQAYQRRASLTVSRRRISKPLRCTGRNHELGRLGWLGSGLGWWNGSRKVALKAELGNLKQAKRT